DETQIFRAAHRACRKAERFEPHLVTRRLVVERKGRAAMPDFNEPARELEPDRWRSRTPGMGARRLICRNERADRKHVLDVHQDEAPALQRRPPRAKFPRAPPR